MYGILWLLLGIVCAVHINSTFMYSFRRFVELNFGSSGFVTFIALPSLVLHIYSLCIAYVKGGRGKSKSVNARERAIIDVLVLGSTIVVRGCFKDLFIGISSEWDLTFQVMLAFTVELHCIYLMLWFPLSSAGILDMLFRVVVEIVVYQMGVSVSLSALLLALFGCAIFARYWYASTVTVQKMIPRICPDSNRGRDVALLKLLVVPKIEESNS